MHEFPMLFNGRALIFPFSGTQVRIAEHERLQSLFKVSMPLYDTDSTRVGSNGIGIKLSRYQSID